MRDLQSEIQTLFESLEIQARLEAFVAWAEANPLPAALWVGGISILLIAVCTLVVRSLRKAPPPPAPEVEPEAVAEPAAVAAEPAPEALPEPQAVPVPAPEPVPEIEAAPEPELEPVPEPEAAPEPEPVPEPEEAPAPPPPPVRLRDRLRLTSENLVGRLSQLLGGRTLDAELLEDLEMLLFSADLGVQTAESLLETVRTQAGGGDAGAVRSVLRQAIFEKLQRVEPQDEPLATQGKPHVILVLGVNGSGKTTTIGKLAARYKAAGRSVILGAGDTFRAAASEQLQTWGERVGCDVVSGPSGGDPAAVAFDTVKAAVAREIDVAIVDTAGRLQTKKPLMEELSKLVRVTGRDLPGAPHESLLVLDSNTGQNAISQARLFSEVANVTGLVLTKLDGTAKGGVIVGLADEFGIPVKYVGVGEAIEDLRDFSAEEFVAAVFED
jgi:fused signal recognition particle receptor